VGLEEGGLDLIEGLNEMRVGSFSSLDIQIRDSFGTLIHIPLEKGGLPFSLLQFNNSRIRSLIFRFPRRIRGGCRVLIPPYVLIITVGIGIIMILLVSS